MQTIVVMLHQRSMLVFWTVSRVIVAWLCHFLMRRGIIADDNDERDQRVVVKIIAEVMKPLSPSAKHLAETLNRKLNTKRRLMVKLAYAPKFSCPIHITKL